MKDDQTSLNFLGENDIMTVGLSQPNALTPISDPIHGSIDLTIFDRDLVDHRLFQRLHFVLQNSVNYVAFPSNKNTRFPHSLGVAHLCSRMFANAMCNSDSRTLERFLHSAADFMVCLDETLSEPSPSGLVSTDTGEDGLHRYARAHLATISGRSEFLHVPMPYAGTERRIDQSDLFGTGSKKLSAAFIIDTLWQSVRLYGLVHDLGHLPMSHAFETAMAKLPQTLRALGGEEGLQDQARELHIRRRDDVTGFTDSADGADSYFEGFAGLLKVEPEAIKAVSQGKQLHETRGISLYNIFIAQHSKPSACFDSAMAGSIDKYGLFIHHIVLSLILSPAISKNEKLRISSGANGSPHEFLFLHSIRQLVDGEVDGDRIDYTVRDSHESGLQSGKFDFEKLAKFSLLTSDNESGAFAFGFFQRALPSVEQFFEARYQCYKYQIFDRTSVRSNKCVEELVATIVSFAFMYPKTKYAEIVERYGYIRFKNDQVDDLLPAIHSFIEKIDDTSLRTLLFELKEVSTAEEIMRLQRSDDGSGPMALAMLNLIDVVVFRDFSKVATLFKDESLRSIVERATSRSVAQADVAKLAEHLLAYRTDFIYELRKSVWNKCVSISQTPIVVFSADVTAKVFEHGEVEDDDTKDSKRSFEEEVWIVARDGQRDKIALKSPSLRSMYRRKHDDRRAFIYAVGEDLKSPNSPEMELVEHEALSAIRSIFNTLS